VKSGRFFFIFFPPFHTSYTRYSNELHAPNVTKKCKPICTFPKSLVFINSYCSMEPKKKSRNQERLFPDVVRTEKEKTQPLYRYRASNPCCDNTIHQLASISLLTILTNYFYAKTFADSVAPSIVHFKFQLTDTTTACVINYTDYQWRLHVLPSEMYSFYRFLVTHTLQK